MPSASVAQPFVPALPWLWTAGEIVGETALSFVGAFAVIITLQGDSSPAHMKEANKVNKKKSSAEADYDTPPAEYTKNKLGKYEKGNKRRKTDRGGEKGDVRRTRYK